MFLIFSPYVFIFTFLYMVFILFLFFLSSFFYAWVVMEIIMFLFIGISYCITQNNYHSLMSYFLIQSVSSFIILISFYIDNSLLVTISLLLKFSIFPFIFWFINVCYSLPNFLFFLVTTFQKLPVLMIMKLFSINFNSSIIWVSIIIGTLVSGSLMLMLSDFRIVLVSSSLARNSWFFIAHYSPIYYFLAYFLVYSFSFYVSLSFVNHLTKPISSFKTLFFRLVNLSGLPPFPIFFLKLLIIFNYGLIDGLSPVFFLFLIIYSSVLGGYIQLILKHLVNSYSNTVNYFL